MHGGCDLDVCIVTGAPHQRWRICAAYGDVVQITEWRLRSVREPVRSDVAFRLDFRTRTHAEADSVGVGTTRGAH